MTVSFKVRNKDRLYSKLAKLAPAASKELEQAAGQSAKEMTSLAQSYVRVDSGDLRDSIVATPPGGTPPDHSQGARKVPKGAWMVTAGNNAVRYPHLVEYGAKAHKAGGKFAGAAHPGAPAQPYFWPSYRLVRRKHRSRATRAINKSIKDVAKR